MSKNPDFPTQLGDMAGQKHLEDIQDAVIVTLTRSQRGRSEQFAAGTFVCPSTTRSRSFLPMLAKRGHSPDLNGTSTMPAGANES